LLIQDIFSNKLAFSRQLSAFYLYNNVGVASSRRKSARCRLHN